MSKKNKSLVVVNPDKPPKFDLIAVLGRNLPEGYYLSTLPLDTAAAVAGMSAFLASPAQKLWNVRGGSVLIENLIVHDSMEEDEETGDLVMVKRLTLIDSEGIAFSTPSPYARRSLMAQLVRLAQPPCLIQPPYDPPLKIDVKEEQSENQGRTWLNLIVVAPPRPPAREGGGS